MGGAKAAASGPGAKKDAAMKDHIDSGAAAEDAKADLEDKKKQLVDLTIQQHDEAKKSAVEANGAASASASSDSDSDSDYDGSSDSFSSGSAGGYGESGAADTGPLFENWLSTFDKETKERIAAQERAKEFKEKLKAAKAAEKKAKAAEKSTKDKMQEELQKADEKKKKAVEKKQKAVETEERLKKKFEKEVKKLQGREVPNCGPIKEKEKKAKEQITKLQEENQRS